MDDVKSKIGTKGMVVAGIGLAVLFLVILSRQSGNDATTETTVIGIASYPDAVTNANVIIDTLQDSIDYSEKNIIDAVGDMGNTINENMVNEFDYFNSVMGDGFDKTSDSLLDLKETMTDNFTATNDYINDGFDAQKEILDMNFDNIMGSITDVQSGLNNMVNEKTQIQTSISETQSQIKGESTTITKNNTATVTKGNTSYYQYKTKSGLNTNQSIVDALKAIGVDSSKANREKIAKANGISNYTGTYSQNVEMLNKLKGGTLKKVS